LAYKQEKVEKPRFPAPLGEKPDLSQFKFEEAIEQAKTKEGYLFKAAGLTFKLYMRCNVSDEKEGTVAISLFRWDGERFQPAAFLDMIYTSDEKGPIADCRKPVINPNPDVDDIRRMDEIRNKESEFGYWVDPVLSKTKGQGGFLLGIGRLLLTMQGEYAKSIGVRRLAVITPTDTEYETLLHFFVDKVNATVHRRPDERKLEVEISGETRFPKPEITASGLNPFEFHEPTDEFLGKLTGVMKEPNPNLIVKFTAAREKWILIVRSRNRELREEQRKEFARIEEVTINLFHVKSDGGVEIAGFIDCTNIFPNDPNRSPWAEMIHDPITKSGEWVKTPSEFMEMIKMMDDFRKQAEPDPKLGYKIPFQIAKDFSRHQGGSFTHVGRFMLSLHDIHQRSQGIRKIMIPVPDFEDATNYFKDFYEQRGAKVSSESSGKYMIIVDITTEKEVRPVLMQRKEKITLDQFTKR